MSGIYGKKLVVHTGKVNDYLGINFDFSEKRQVKIDMIVEARDTGFIISLRYLCCRRLERGCIRSNVSRRQGQWGAALVLLSPVTVAD